MGSAPCVLLPDSCKAVFSNAPQQNFIDLTWAPNTDADLAGYNLYRIEGHDGQWRCEAIWRSLARDGEAIVETKRIVRSD